MNEELLEAIRERERRDDSSGPSRRDGDEVVSKQVKCNVFVRRDGKIGGLADDRKPGARDMSGEWMVVELTGTLPEPTEGPPAEPERTCEVRWTERIGDHPGYWWFTVLGTQYSGENLPAILSRAAELGFRVTNDPREVVLVERGAALWYLEDDNNASPMYPNAEEAREAARACGWRVLREEPAERPCTRSELVSRCAELLGAIASELKRCAK